MSLAVGRASGLEADGAALWNLMGAI